MKKTSTIRMSMFCPDVPPTPFGMIDRNVTKRRAPKSSKKATAESSKLSLRRPEPSGDGGPSDRENEPPPPPSAAPQTPRRQGRRLFSRPEIAEIDWPAGEPPALPAARAPLRPADQRAGRQRRLEEPEPRPQVGTDRDLQTDELLKKMTEMSLVDNPASGDEDMVSGDGRRAGPVLPSGEEMATDAEQGGHTSPERGLGKDVSPEQQCVAEECPPGSPSVGRSVGRRAAASSPGSGPDSAAAPLPPPAGPGQRRPLSSDSFVSAASSPPAGPPTAPAPAPAGRHDSDSESDSERSLPYFTPRRPSRRRPPVAVDESSDEASDTGGGVPLLVRALRRLPATTSTPAAGDTAGWRLDATGMPSPVLETEPAAAQTPARGSGGQPAAAATDAPSGRPAADSPLIVGQHRRQAVADTPRTLAEETAESSSSSAEPPPPPVVAARAPLRAAGRPAASPAARPPPLPAGAAAGFDVARWLEESPLLTAGSEESDVVVIDSDQEWDDSDLLSVSERAAAAGVAADSGLGPPPPLPPPPPQTEPSARQPRPRRGLPRPDVAPTAAPRTSPPRRVRRQSSGSSSSEDGLEKFKRQFVTPKQKRRPPSPSSAEDDFIDDGPLSSDGDHSSYRRAVAADSVTKRTPRVDPQICASDESLEPADVSPEEAHFRPPPPRQVLRRPAVSAPVPPSPRTGRSLGFMSSLAAHLVDGVRRHPEAAGFVAGFRSKRLQLARRLFDMVNSEVFESQLPTDLEIKFNKRMLRTAGYCYSRQSASAAAGSDGCRSARVELSEKVVDSAERLRDTLVHELCHAAAWVVSGYRGGHGPVWRAWAARVQRRYPELPPVTRCHSYQIHCKYTYRCTGCGYSFGRHSKSLDTTRKVCGRCRGVFECLLTARLAGGGGGGGGGSAPATPRAAAPFALFVKEHYSAVKSASAGLRHAEVMRLLGQKFAEAKISRAKAKAAECDEF